jgi:hypothetical protein
VQERVLLRHEHGYQFEHDRLQECAYALIPVDDRAATHLRIGRLLASKTQEGATATSIFAILDHLNRALDLLHDPAERLNYARLNLSAGRLAVCSLRRRVSAFPAALLLSRTRGKKTTDWRWLHSEAAEAAFPHRRFQGSGPAET